MATIRDIPVATLVPDDPRAVYVWASALTVSAGYLTAYRSDKQAKSEYPKADWDRQIGLANELADKVGFPVVYVVRNAQGS